MSNAGGDELDPRGFDLPTVDPNRSYNQVYASIKAAGKFQLVLAPEDADVVLQVRLSPPVTALEFHIGGSGDPILKLAVLDPKSNVLLWAFSETVPAATHQVLAKLLNQFTSLCFLAR